jgi:hypothetical protein
VLELLRGLKGVNLVGGDVVEVAPQYDATTNTAHVGAQVLFEILSLMAFSLRSSAGRTDAKQARRDGNHAARRQPTEENGQ